MIDNGLRLIRQLWDAGLAHRDIKPANLMVRDGKVLLVDAFFVQVRPSPWRQAVDLANMMLVLAVRTDATACLPACPRVLQRGRDRRGVRRHPRGGKPHSAPRRPQERPQDGRDLLREFRDLAPQRRPVAIQHWSLRRIGLEPAGAGPGRARGPGRAHTWTVFA